MDLFASLKCNGDNGGIISLAFVTEEGIEWYNARVWDDERVMLFVAQFIISRLYTAKLSPNTFDAKFREFILGLGTDYLEIHFLNRVEEKQLNKLFSRLIGEDDKIQIRFTRHQLDDGEPLGSEIPNNALSDAKALRVAAQKQRTILDPL